MKARTFGAISFFGKSRIPPQSKRTLFQIKTWFQNRRAKWRRVRKDGEDEEDLTTSGLMLNCAGTSTESTKAPNFHNAPTLLGLFKAND
jgi:hypothetical protein